MPYKEHTITIDFGALGEPDYWVTIKDPQWLRGADLRDPEGNEVREVDLGKLLILDWNLEDPTTGERLPAPATANGDAAAIFDRVPLGMLKHLRERLQEAVEAPLSPSGSPTS